MTQKRAKNKAMTANAVVRARINEAIKEEATAILAAMGLTPSDAFRILMTKIAKEKALPFEPLIPNEETIAAMKEARKGKLQSFTSMDDLMADLNAND
jgi:DNA-damage-inducible protein J